MARARCTDPGCPYEGQKPASGCLCLQDEPAPGGALTIYECPQIGCGAMSRHPEQREGQCWANDHGEPVPVRVFREEDVRPLWDHLHDIRHEPLCTAPKVHAQAALDAFPAPEEWTR